jgi:ribulose-phosphate 3-epimerase
MSNTVIAPSTLSADFNNLGYDINAIEAAGADWIHCDVMDGAFVPNISFGPMIVEAVNRITDLPLDVHLMINEPIKYIEQFRAAGADIITVHSNACSNLGETIAKIRESGAKVGVAVNPDIPIDTFTNYIENIDLVLIMSVFAGFGGQSFIGDAMDKVKAIKELVDSKNLSIDIEVDGGVNDITAKECISAGANALVAGSYVFKGDYKQRIDSIR